MTSSVPRRAHIIRIDANADTLEGLIAAIHEVAEELREQVGGAEQARTHQSGWATHGTGGFCLYAFDPSQTRETFFASLVELPKGKAA